MKSKQGYMEVKEFLTNGPANMAIVVLDTKEYVLKPLGDYSKSIVEEILCVTCEAGVAKVVTTTGIVDVRTENHTVIDLDSFVNMEDYEILLYVTLFKDGRLKPLMKYDDVDGDNIDELLTFDINKEKYVITEPDAIKNVETSDMNKVTAELVIHKQPKPLKNDKSYKDKPTFDMDVLKDEFKR